MRFQAEAFTDDGALEDVERVGDHRLSDPARRYLAEDAETARVGRREPEAHAVVVTNSHASDFRAQRCARTWRGTSGARTEATPSSAPSS